MAWGGRGAFCGSVLNTRRSSWIMNGGADRTMFNRALRERKKEKNRGKVGKESGVVKKE